MSFSVHRPGRFGSDGRIEFGVDGETPDDLYLDDVRAAQAPEGRDAQADADGPEDPYPVTRDLLEDALAMNPTQPVTSAEPAAEEAQPTIGEWGALDEPAAVEEVREEPVAEASVPPVRAKRVKRRR